jgi:photosystem II stability/assembly factor-like uncharacterized protein
LRKSAVALIGMLVMTTCLVAFPASSWVKAAPTDNTEYAGWCVGAALDGYGTILHTTDGGATWVRQGTPQNIPNVGLGSAAALDADNCWVVGDNINGYGTILRTSDGGVTWVRQGSPGSIPDEGLLKMSAVDINNAWAVGSTGTILFTSDGGKTWVSRSTATVPKVMLQGVFAIDADNVWVTGAPDGGYGTVLRTTNGGQTWERKGSLGVFPISQIQDVHAVDQNNAWFVNTSTQGHPPVISVLRTIDNGNSWTSFPLHTSGDTNAVTTVGSNIVWAVCDYGGIFRTDDNGQDQFPEQTSAPGSCYLMSIYAQDSNTAWTCGGIHNGTGHHGTIQHTVDGGKTWNSQLDINIELGGISMVKLLDTYTFYFAEGYTGEGFDEWLCLMNPGPAAIAAHITYMFTDGATQVQEVPMGATTRVTVKVNDIVGPDKDVSIKVEAEAPIVAERPMYFNYGGVWTGGHCVVGATAPAADWYFAEGYTGEGFDEYICVLNPGDTAADLTFRFQTQEAGEITKTGYSVGPHTRGTFKVNDVLGPEYQTSLKLESTQPVVAERPMYFNYNGEWTGGHCVMGASALSKGYYFAEGTTRSNFQEYLTLQNPNTTAMEVEATYQLASGTPVGKTYNIPAASRSTVYVPDEVGADQDVSVYLSSAADFLVERPMYFNYQDVWTGGHCVIGASAASPKWFFAEGYTGPGFEEWLCLQNPGTAESTVEITYLTQEDGALPVKTVKVPAGSRQTVFVNTDAGEGYQLSAKVVVTAGPGMVVERPMYFNFQDQWDGGSDVVGYRP